MYMHIDETRTHIFPSRINDYGFFTLDFIFNGNNFAVFHQQVHDLVYAINRIYYLAALN